MRLAEHETVMAVASRQGGHVTRGQIYGAGIARTTVDGWLRRGELVQVFTGVYAVGHVPTEPGARAWAGLLACGDRACLAGHSAAYVLGVSTGWREPIELVTTHNRSRPGLIVRRSKTLLRRDVWNVHGLRVTSPARTALDLMPRLSHKRRVRLINELRMEQRLTVGQLREVIARNERHRGASILRELIGDAQREPTRSDLEDAFLEIVKRYELPVPLINTFVGVHRVDAFFPQHGLIVELDGWNTHGWKQAFEADRAQVIDLLATTGYPTLRLSYDQTTGLAARTARQLRAALDRLATPPPSAPTAAARQAEPVHKAEPAPKLEATA